MPMKAYDLNWGTHRLELGRRTMIMGILNVTPDSFSDGGHFFDFQDAVSQGEKLVADGADILDIGGESTRPFSDGITAEEEMRRVIPVIEQLRRHVDVPISIDTTKSDVAERALAAGAALINDISALRVDPRLAEVAATHGVPLVLMHMRGTPRSMQVDPHYDDLIGEIKAFLAAAVEQAVLAGVARRHLIIDPGIGFGKTFHHNLEILNNLGQFADLDLPVLVGSSHKAFIRNLLKPPQAKDLSPEAPIVETGTQATVAAAALNGAHIVRVHDVATTRATLKIIDAVKNAGPET
jgi:dihydropteroate synthase